MLLLVKLLRLLVFPEHNQWLLLLFLVDAQTFLCFGFTFLSNSCSLILVLFSNVFCFVLLLLIENDWIQIKSCYFVELLRKLASGFNLNVVLLSLGGSSY